MSALAFTLWAAFGLALWTLVPGEQIFGFWRNVAYWGILLLLADGDCCAHRRRRPPP